jgi:multidrug resistance protein
VSNLEKGVVGWESQDDPELPLNFPEGRKFLLLGLISIITLISPLASSMFAPGVTFMNKEFNNTSTILTSFSVSVFVLGYAIGPILLSPLSEIYGRRPVLTGANAFFVVWQIGCALAPNLGSLIVFRLLAGIGGSGCITIGGGVIADLFRPDQRGFASSIYSLGPLFGPVIGPICGGFIAQRAGWRWVFWVLLIAAGLISLFIECFNKETNHRVLIRRKVHRLRKELNRPELRSVYTKEGEAPKSPTAVLLQGMLRPLKMLCRSAITALMAIYMAVVYGLLYLLFTTISTVYMSQYGWQPEITGLAYLGIGIGFFLGVAVVAKISDKTVVRMTLANGGVFEPEMRLPACVFFACFVPISFFWYGWCAYKQVHWIVPIIGLMPFGFGMMGIFIPIQTYMIDAFPEYAASAIAALTIVRSLFGAFLPLAGPKMYATLNLGWGNSLLGFVALALIPVPLGIYKYGKYIRTNYPIKL